MYFVLCQNEAVLVCQGWCLFFFGMGSEAMFFPLSHCLHSNFSTFVSKCGLILGHNTGEHSHPKHTSFRCFLLDHMLVCVLHASQVCSKLFDIYLSNKTLSKTCFSLNCWVLMWYFDLARALHDGYNAQSEWGFLTNVHKLWRYWNWDVSKCLMHVLYIDVWRCLPACNISEAQKNVSDFVNNCILF